MPLIQPPLPRHKAEDLGDRLWFTIPNPKNWFVILWLGFWAIFGALPLAVLLLSVVQNGKVQLDTPLEPALGLTLYLLCNGVVIVLPIYAILWQLSGKEIIEASQHSLKIRRLVAGLGRMKEYPIAEIRELQVVPVSDFRWFAPALLLSLLRGTYVRIIFTPSAKAIRFGGFVDEAEAKQIVATIQKRFAGYGTIKRTNYEAAPPPSPRLTIEEKSESLKIIIPSRKHWLVIFFAGAFLIFWTFLGVSFAASLFSPPTNTLPQDASEAPLLFWILGGALWLFFVVWALGMVYIWAAIACLFLWPFFGREVIEIKSGSFAIHRELLGLRWSNSFKVEYVRDFRISSDVLKYGMLESWNLLQDTNLTKGSVLFDYGSKTFDCSSGADSVEARQIVALIQQRFPQYLDTSSS